MSYRPLHFGLLVAVALASCTTASPLYCDEETPCTDPALRFCDFDVNKCIEPPAGACASHDGCDGAHEPICDEGARQCRGCVTSDECAARSPDAPTCADDGACVAACEGFEDCDDPFAPICADDGLCAACDLDSGGDADCAARDAEAPYCLEGGDCAACRDESHCSAEAPVCDPDDHICRPCEDRAECPSGVCDTGSGQCIAEGQVVYVEDAGSGSSCTQAAPCGSIQDGIDVAGASRPFILVSPGSYNEAVTIADKTFTMFAHGAELAPDSAGEPALRVSSGSDITVEGLRLHGATEDDGHGLRCSTGSDRVTIALRDVVIDGNEGHGILSFSCEIRAEAATIEDNEGYGIRAAETAALSPLTLLTLERSVVASSGDHGISASDAIVTLDESELIANRGDGVSALATTVTLTSALVSDNESDGIRAGNSTLKIEDSSITGNGGRGILVEAVAFPQSDDSARPASSEGLEISRSTISDNRGGGVEAAAREFRIENNFIVRNGEGGEFGGVRIATSESPAHLAFNTIADNSASSAAGGVSCSFVDTPLTFSSNLIYGNEGEQVAGENCDFTFSNIQDGPTENGNIDADPRFVDPQDGDYRLQPDSPCIDAADPDTELEVDFFGTERPQGEGFDIGAFEYSP